MVFFFLCRRPRIGDEDMEGEWGGGDRCMVEDARRGKKDEQGRALSSLSLSLFFWVCISLCHVPPPPWLLFSLLLIFCSNGGGRKTK